ncbi:MAG: DUF4065 domain-containing protein [Prevotella sp.]|nr:DUF4065 domain-containing protein [Prevotella sp.]MDE6011955.1 DUF4065 domain-containing protein [Prevotella sp.]
MTATNNLQKMDSIVLSNYILKHYGPMSHLKLQKLLFYCDAYCLAYFGQELVEDVFEAWAHGPVCRKVYDSLKDKSVLYSDLEYSNTGIDVDVVFAALPTAQRELIGSILADLSNWSGMELEAATHREYPWQQARSGIDDGAKCHAPISKDITREFYHKEQGL